MLCPAVGLEHSKKVRELLYRRILRAWGHNTKKADASHIHDDRYYTEAEINYKMQSAWQGNETGITVINSAVASSLTASVSYSGNICHVDFTVHLASPLTGYGRPVVGWLQEPCRPAYTAFGICVIQGTRNAVMCEVAPDGGIILWGYGGPDIAAGSRLSGCICYPLNNKL